ncbi:nitroreductase family protein [Pseudoduganella eburnea]|uniref:Nitroreductase family protein n=1 Tax=Massilia eburnea TaxID=1776165 RepID=A0A6L6QIS3_9BURK|nr:nitroreductase family protein [Massilia eburnea]MTW11964.1 nitroreductase family protein [Massilia eburnea]
MNKPIKDLIESRVSANYFDPVAPVSDAQVAELVRLATLAPSAYNVQNWQFVAVRSQEAREKLRELSFGQQKVVDAPVIFIISGTLRAQDQVAAALKPAVDKGILIQPVVDSWIRMAQSMDGDERAQRDEALRSASLAAMTMILAAEGMGLSSCAMTGFDAEAVHAAFGLGANEVPVMLVAVGHAAKGNWPQKPRRPLDAVLRYA